MVAQIGGGRVLCSIYCLQSKTLMRKACRGKKGHWSHDHLMHIVCALQQPYVAVNDISTHAVYTVRCCGVVSLTECFAIVVSELLASYQI